MEVAEALRQMGRGETIHAFKLDYEKVFDYQVGLVFANDLPLIGYRVNGLGDDCYASKG